MTTPRQTPKQSLYIPLDLDLLAVLRSEAKRLDRSLSWVVRYALTRGGIASLKAMPDAV